MALPSSLVKSMAKLANKSFITNFVSFLLFAGAYFLPRDFCLRIPLMEAGLFALSGAFTNWIAIYMLFEKIPGLYGSGIVPARFQEFKKAIRNLIMEQFFTPENFKKYVQKTLQPNIDMGEILDKLFDELVHTVENSSPLKSILAFFKGKNIFEPLRQPFKTRAMNFMENAGFLQKIVGDDPFSKLKPQVEAIVEQKLEELTPEKVKEIIQNMIRKHLGWLVIWGGVFGGLIGLVFSIIKM